MRNFADLLVRRIAELENPTVMGLDPKLEYIPQKLIDEAIAEFPDDGQKATAHAIWLFNKALIDAVYDIVPAIKPQLAYYELYGIEALKVLDKTVKYAQSKDMLVIADCKRNDIGATSTAYAEGIIGSTQIIDGSSVSMMGSDCATVNGYLGIDGVKPFLDVCSRDGKGIFILVRTSNPSAGDLQDLELKDGRKVYEAMAALVNGWGKDLVGEEGFSSVGAVVGATWPEQAVEIRKLMPDNLILVPGYGAQGAGPDAAVASFTADGRGSIVNASRSLMCAWKKREDLDPSDFAAATRDEAIDMKTKLNNALKDRKYV
ncbi:orotidine-5'-phosphate decarboxylase [Ruminococcaceae bacterium YRB3002]|nr:orotidine-5'-phosphate decarboxylase [Ruminococcaceae bacterium YRB3002]